MKNLSVNNKNKKWPKFLAVAVVLLLILFILNIFVAPIRNYFFTASSSIQKTFWSAGETSAGVLSFPFKAGSLEKENENLKIENQNLLSQVAALQSVEQGNPAQSQVSISCQNSGFQFVMAGVIGLDNDILSISKGSVDGITEGMPVINQQNVLVGKVFKVYTNFSEIMLVSNKNSVINVKVQQNNVQNAPANLVAPSDPNAPAIGAALVPSENLEIDGVVKGDGGLNAHLDLIPINSSVNPEDVLVTSSLEKSFPKDLLLGKVIKMTKNDQKPFQQGQVKLFFDVKTADNLFVITNYKR